jgi:hypothetical protein
MVMTVPDPFTPYCCAALSQARMYGDPDGQAQRMAQMRTTVKTQEEIIRNLEVP